MVWSFFSKDGRKEDDDGGYLLNFYFISGFNNHSVGEENSPRIHMKWLRLQDQVLKCTLRLCWLISPNSARSCSVAFFMMLVSA